jgi:3-oxoacyl-[acyl-carrier protein] reductase
MAKELAGRGIRVNAVAPGFIVSKMTDALSDEVRSQMLAAIPAGRFGTADDVAKSVVFLASDDAAYVTGQVLSVNGGMVM